MDEEEREIRKRELRAQHRSIWISASIATLSFVVSSAAVASSVFFSTRQLRASDEEFRQNVRSTTYNDIVAGLGSSAAAVQTNSMRLLTQFVRDRSNYDSKEEQEQGVVNAIQALTAFIEDKSGSEGPSGLKDYTSPEPIVLSRAIVQVRSLISDDKLGRHAADISRANLHGLSLPKFHPQGTLIAVSTDFRRANLTDLNLTADAASLERSFLTCANLTRAKFGKASLKFVDLTGANLAGADLSGVRGLTSAQVHGARISATTKLPSDVMAPVSDGWGVGSNDCVELVNDMTGMAGGQGYDERHPCPTDMQTALELHDRPPFRGDLRDLVRACTLRGGA